MPQYIYSQATQNICLSYIAKPPAILVQSDNVCSIRVIARSPESPRGTTKQGTVLHPAKQSNIELRLLRCGSQ